MPKTLEVEDTAPPAEIDPGENNSDIGSLLEGRHERTLSHEPRREVGERQPVEDDEDDDEPVAAAAPAAAAAPGAQPAPQAATPPAAGAEADPASDPKAPKWYRDHMRKMNAEVAADRAELARLRAGGAPATTTTPPAGQPRPQPTPLPNPAEDPEGYHRAITGGFRSEMSRFRLETTLNLSERFARQQHGNEAFEETKAWLTTRPDLEDFFLTQPDPWGAAFSHYSREKLADEIGDDPNAWREKERQRIRDEILAEQGAAPRDPAPAPQMRAAPPAAASTARSAAPRDPQSGRFTGPAPLKTRNSFD